MTVRCGCDNEGDETLFGPAHECSTAKLRLQAELDRMEREEPTVAEAMAGMERAAEHILGRLPSPVVAAIYDLERPYEQVLSRDGSGEALPPWPRSAYPPDSKPLPYETVLSDGDGDLG